MYYVIIGHDAPDSLPKRQAVRAEHLARVAALRDEGRLLLAGPMPAIDSPDPGPAGFSGSLIVAEFVDLAAARRWTAADPYLAAGAWARAETKPFIKALP